MMMSYNDDTNDTNIIDYINADNKEAFKAVKMSKRTVVNIHNQSFQNQTENRHVLP